MDNHNGRTPIASNAFAAINNLSLLKWLQDNLQINLQMSSKLPHNYNNHNHHETEEWRNVPIDLTELGEIFQDGVLLGRLIQRLERREIPGLEMRPKHHAQKLQNIRRSLEFLAQFNHRIPLRTLSCEEEISRGDGAVVLALLCAIKHAYLHHKA